MLGFDKIFQADIPLDRDQRSYFFLRHIGDGGNDLLDRLLDILLFDFHHEEMAFTQPDQSSP